MDELWQRYRSFWTPVLIGLGVFLVGWIVVSIITDNPQTWKDKAANQKRVVEKKVAPTKTQISLMRSNRDVLAERVVDWARRLDQAGLDDPVEVVVAGALRASILRGLEPDAVRAAVTAPTKATSKALLERFEGDEVAAGRALTRYEEVRQDRLNLLRTGDPNVGFSRLLFDVWSEFRVRANRADVELRTDVLGFGGVTSVTRPALVQRALNLALVSEIVDLAIRAGVSSILEVRLEQRQNPVGDDVFLREWPVTIKLRGDMVSMRPILSRLTDPERPIAVSNVILAQPPRGSPLEGQVELTARASSVLVRSDVGLALDLEDLR